MLFARSYEVVAFCFYVFPKLPTRMSKNHNKQINQAVPPSLIKHNELNDFGGWNQRQTNDQKTLVNFSQFIDSGLSTTYSS